jgi:glutamyl-tRNA reductase
MAEPLAVEAIPAAGAKEPPLVLVGVDHHCAGLELRERVVYSDDASEELLVRLMTHSEIAEAYLLSTCNRTELYLLHAEQETAVRTALDLTFSPCAPEIEEQGRFFVLHDHEAARHLLSVAAGLESMVLGEPEILGQVKQAAQLADGVGSCGTVMRKLLFFATHSGKRARSETGIGNGAVSLGYSVVELARQIFDRLEDRKVLILGAGETARLAARALAEKGIGELWVANRSPERLAEFQKAFPTAHTLPLEERFVALEKADLLVTATSAPEPLVRRFQLAEVMRQRAARPILAVDLGVPRNIHGDAAGVENLFLHDLDSLRHLIDRNLAQRQAEVPRVERIVSEEIQHFLDWYRGLEAEPLIAELQRRAEQIRTEEVERVRDRFPAEVHEDLERLTRSLVRKILHHPSRQLRSQPHNGSLPHLQAVRDLFQLDGAESEEEQDEAGGERR